ncbi:MAG: FecR domain-containing protein [Burkholderiales bacterium]|nr:FecR domain-containing protein [Burkholderiales bacterium]
MRATVLVWTLAAAGAAPVYAAQPAGVVKIVKGSVAVERAQEKHAAVPGLGVQAGDRVVTGRDGQVGITLRDNTLLSAGPNSTVVLDEFEFDSTTHAGVVDASVRRGTLSVVSGKIARQSPETVRFRTPNAMLGVRGTSFVIEVGAEAP